MYVFPTHVIIILHILYILVFSVQKLRGSGYVFCELCAMFSCIRIDVCVHVHYVQSLFSYTLGYGKTRTEHCT